MQELPGSGETQISLDFSRIWVREAPPGMGSLLPASAESNGSIPGIPVLFVPWQSGSRVPAPLLPAGSGEQAGSSGIPGQGRAGCSLDALG